MAYDTQDKVRYAIMQQSRDYPLQFTFCGSRDHEDDALIRARELMRLDPDLIVNVWVITQTHVLR